MRRSSSNSSLLQRCAQLVRKQCSGVAHTCISLGHRVFRRKRSAPTRNYSDKHVAHPAARPRASPHQPWPTVPLGRRAHCRDRGWYVFRLSIRNVRAVQGLRTMILTIVRPRIGARMARLFYYVRENFGPEETFAFFYSVCHFVIVLFHPMSRLITLMLLDRATRAGLRNATALG